MPSEPSRYYRPKDQDLGELVSRIILAHSPAKVKDLIAPVPSEGSGKFDSGRVLVTTVQRVHIKMMVAAFAFNLYQLCTLKNTKVI